MPNVIGEIAAEFAVRSGRTQLVRKFHTSPLKIAKTFRYENETLLPDAKSWDQLGVYMMDCSPGLMSGDHYEMNWRLQPGARVFLTNQSFTKVHPSEPGAGSTQRQTIRIGEDAMLEYMPEPIMLYKDASFQGELEVHVAPGGIFMLAEVICPGRTQRGEIFHYASFRNRMRVYEDERLIYYQHQKIEPASMRLSAPGCWERETHLGTLYVFSDRIGQRHVEAVLEELERLNTLPIRCGASLTYKHGMLVTVMGEHAWQLQHALDQAWKAVRSSLLSLSPLQIHK